MSHLVLTLDDSRMDGWNDSCGHHDRSITTAEYLDWRDPHHVTAIVKSIASSFAELELDGNLNPESILANSSYRCGLGSRALQGFLNHRHWFPKALPADLKEKFEGEYNSPAFFEAMAARSPEMKAFAYAKKSAAAKAKKTGYWTS